MQILFKIFVVLTLIILIKNHQNLNNYYIIFQIFINSSKKLKYN